MSDMPPWEWDWTAIAAFVAAAVALYGSWRAAKISKANLSSTIELQIAQFRQKWINDLRVEMSGFSECLLVGVWDSATLNRANGHTHKITLMMNPEDPLFDALNTQINTLVMRKTWEMAVSNRLTNEPEIQEMIARYPEDIHNDEKYSAHKFILISQKILKSEWDRLKSDIGNK